MRILGLLASLVIWCLIAVPCSSQCKDGPRRWERKLKALEVVEYKLDFAPYDAKIGNAANFAVIGDGETDVDIHVYKVVAGQRAENPFVSDTGNTDIARCTWQPEKGFQYVVRVQNLGKKANTCIMAHN